ncbi:hypothetical protein [Pelagicoccus mobilis]|uniref:Uncharacterized protein n=1 Tax=Pelagicoccus mobilis TaxID=415221 RepID=A0A934VRD0_9BACT|nr:hypothetical protein [Pelagicoccus mobilis]MBK1879262.1 hypothetical protein [Pelagicoccus mobilis]
MRKKLVGIAMGLAGIVSVLLLWSTTDDEQLNFPLEYEAKYPPPQDAKESQKLLKELSNIEFILPPDPIQSSAFFRDFLEEETKGSGIYRLKEGVTVHDIIAESREHSTDPDHTLGFSQSYYEKLTSEKKSEYVLTHRAEVEARWSSQPELDELLKELDNFELIGGNSEYSLDTSTVFTGYTRTIAKELSKRAYLLLVQGHPDQALLELHRMMSIANKTLPDSRTLIECLTVVAVTAICLEPANYIVDNYDISKRLIQPTTANIHPTLYPIEILERNFDQEIVYLYEGFLLQADLHNSLYPLFLPKASANLVYDYWQDVLQALRDGRIEHLTTLEQNFTQSIGRFRIRNPMGHTLAASMAPSIAQFYEIYEKSDLARRDYIRKLEAVLQK